VAGRALSEDALTVNVWTPSGPAPSEGWPVYIYIHGGWLQIGNPAMTDKNNGADLLDEGGVKVSIDLETTPRADQKVVLVAVAYRLSLFVSDSPLNNLSGTLTA
jgi:carboxylesterase type B